MERIPVTMQKMATCLWFDGQAEEAVRFYTSIIKGSKVLSTARYGKEGAKASGRPEGSIMTITFELNGQEFMALNAGPEFSFNPAISFMLYCDTQEEVDYLWDKLSEGGEPWECGWLRDKYGVAWQIVPTILEKLMDGSDPVRAERLMKAMVQMRKMDIAKLQEAYDQG